MEDTFFLKSILKVSFIYNLFQEIVGGNKSRCKFVTNYVRARPRDKVVEIGCSSAQLLRWLPSVEYIGFDIHKPYIDTAQKIYGHRGLFLVGDTKSLENDHRFLNTDIVICSNILHHLEDEEVFHTIKFAYEILKTGGRLVCGEPCWVPNQSFFAKLVMSNDRGKNIRTEENYLKLAKQVFSNAKSTLDLKPIRIPTTGVAIECTK